MTEITASARAWLAAHRQAVLITLRRDGSPQSSNVVTSFDGNDTFRVSVTTDRVKARNLARDARAVVHVLGHDFSTYAAVTCTAELGPVSTGEGDQAGQNLLELYNAISDASHPNPDEFFAAMVSEHRLLLSLHAETIAGIGWDE